MGQITNATTYPVLGGITDAEKILVVTAAGLRTILKSSLLLAMEQIAVDDTGFTQLEGDTLAEILTFIDTEGVGGGLTPEVDADGERIPIRDESGVVQGYVGWSAAQGGMAIWAGDSDDWETDNAPTVYFVGGDIWIHNAAWSGWLSVAADGQVQIQGGPSARVVSDATLISGNDTVDIDADTVGGGVVRFFNSTNASAGIDGTDTVANATDATSVIARLNELLAVLRNSGLLST